MYFEVKRAELADDFILQLEYEDGSTGKVDVSKYIAADTVFFRLQDPAYFRTFRIEYGTIVWGEGEVDMAPESLYEEATGRNTAYGLRHRAVS